MKTRIATLFFFVAGIAFAEPRLVGVIDGTKEATQFIIKPSDDGPARWLKMGDSIEGYRISGYLTQEEILVAEKSGKQFRWPLKKSKVVSAVSDNAKKNAPDPLTLESVKKRLADAQKRLKLLSDERQRALDARRARNASQPQQK